MNVLLANGQREQTSEAFSASRGCVGAETSIILYALFCIILLHRHATTNGITSISNKTFHVSQVETDVCYNVSSFFTLDHLRQ